MSFKSLHKIIELIEQIHAGPVKARLRALWLINASLHSQAQHGASVDVFRYLALPCAICIPFGFLFRKVNKEAGAA